MVYKIYFLLSYLVDLMNSKIILYKNTYLSRILLRMCMIIVYICQYWKILIILVFIYLLEIKLKFSSKFKQPIGACIMPTSKLTIFTDIDCLYLYIYDEDKKNQWQIHFKKFLIFGIVLIYRQPLRRIQFKCHRYMGNANTLRRYSNGNRIHSHTKSTIFFLKLFHVNTRI